MSHAYERTDRAKAAQAPAQNAGPGAETLVVEHLLPGYGVGV